LPDLSSPHAYLLLAGEQAEQRGRLLAEQIRDELPQLRLLVNCGGGSFKSQMKRADKSGARLALILGENEISNQQISVKDLRQEEEQRVMLMTELAGFLSTTLGF
jgi:histidyl-tRNA synthetase